MSDSIFTTQDQQNQQLNSRLTRVEGSIPYQRAGSTVYSGSLVKSPTSGAVLTTVKGIGGQIDPVGGVEAQGNAFPFTVQGVFQFSGTSTSITIFWDGSHGSQQFVIKRSNGQNYTIPKGSLVINGLTPGTIYKFTPYLNLTSPNTVSFVVGDSGSPRFAFSPDASSEVTAAAIRQQQLTSNEALTTGFIQFSTAAASGGTSSGGGESPPSTPYCTAVGTPLITPGGSVPNDILYVKFKAREDVFLVGRDGPEKIVAMEIRDLDYFYRIFVRDEMFECSPSTTLKTEDGKHVWCELIKNGSLIDTVNGYKEMYKQQILMPIQVMQIELEGPSHEYRVVSVWTHNIKVNPN